MQNLNVFKNFFGSPVFKIVLIVTVVFQAILVELLGYFARTVSLEYWLWIMSVGLGSLALPISTVVKLFDVPEESFFDKLAALRVSPYLLE